MPIQLICQLCSAAFHVRPSLSHQKYCSQKCRDAARAKRRKVFVCAHCGTEQELPPWRYKPIKNNYFCSTACRRAYHKQRRASFSCEVCGKLFTKAPCFAEAKANRFCSAACQKAAPSHGIKVYQRYVANDTFFNVWTLEMSYTLGLLVTDGCVHHDDAQKIHHISFGSTDAILSNIVRDYLSPDGIVHKYPIPRCNPSYRVNIHSIPAIHRLIELGVTPRKSNTLTMPPVPDEVFSHFARGVLDGDGSVWIKKGQRCYGYSYPNYRQLLLQFAGVQEFLNELSKRLTRLASVGPRKFYPAKHSKCSGHISFGSKDSCRLFPFLYGPRPERPSLPHLPRKWQRFMRFREYALARGYWRAE